MNLGFLEERRKGEVILHRVEEVNAQTFGFGAVSSERFSYFSIFFLQVLFLGKSCTIAH